MAREQFLRTKPNCIVAAGFVSQRRSQPAFADAGRTAQDHVVVGVDPASLGELVEQRAVETARGFVIDILDNSLMTQPGVTQTCRQAPVVAPRGFAIEQQAEPFGMAQRRGFAGCFDLAEGLGHAVEAELTEQVEGRMREQG